MDQEKFKDHTLYLNAKGVNYGEDYTMAVKLTLSDINDNAPYFHDTPYALRMFLFSERRHF
jgi:hypothetical protein